ncbi:protein phosphatase 1 regulatory subunit INH3 [Eucalyptus grandis]|uniref:Uncharacterized protein n=3 Tax=Eucalyptus TaxID=3932 RepID=A0ACC3JL06_EUCGR|nr:protein phosphatase 1 regulatory subunit INH3 [Eucalyptus grandis]KAK3414220.1 hypothetical protein EUGRSUZ_I02713 [Eucalyptus grandis]
MARSMVTMTNAATASPSVTATVTVTVEDRAPPPASSSSSQSGNTALVLRLKRVNDKKKKVTWKEGTVDNEFLQKKSSKKCCIFHKEKSFDEDCSSDEDGDAPDHPHRHPHPHHGDEHRCDGGASCSNDGGN